MFVRFRWPASSRWHSWPAFILICLQKHAGREQIAEFATRFPITDLGDRLDETTGAYLDTPAGMLSLDLVITPDSSLAHAAGALGVPVWLALPHVPEFRWLLDREDSPWYPTMRLFRQSSPGNWPEYSSAWRPKWSHGSPGVLDAPASIVVPLCLGGGFSPASGIAPADVWGSAALHFDTGTPHASTIPHLRPTMGYRNLRACVDDLAAVGQLVRIEEPIDPYLDVAQIQRRVALPVAQPCILSGLAAAAFRCWPICSARSNPRDISFATHSKPSSG